MSKKYSSPHVLNDKLHQISVPRDKQIRFLIKKNVYVSSRATVQNIPVRIITPCGGIVNWASLLAWKPGLLKYGSLE